MESGFFSRQKRSKIVSYVTAQLVCQGMCKQVEIIRSFGVSKNSVSRSVKKYREKGAEAFFASRKARGGSVLTEEVKSRVQNMLDTDMSLSDIAIELDIKYDTLRKAVNQGRLYNPSKKKK